LLLPPAKNPAVPRRFSTNFSYNELIVRILVLNCGSSSVKFQLIETAAPGSTANPNRKLAIGLVDRFGARSVLMLKAGGAAKSEDKLAIANHEAAVRMIIERLGLTAAGASRIDAVGHRVVHGGELFTVPVAIDEDTLARIESLNELAPLHNPAAVSGIHAARKIFGAAMPMAAVFDTAFHHTIPENAATYAIPYDLARKHGIRRYGFHGMAHQCSLLRYSEISGTPAERLNLVTLHLGNGSSACAIRAGKSVDTSMGFTPLEGLVMGSRSGDLDPALVSYLARKESVDAAMVEHWLNECSGLLGLSGFSNDMRELLEASRTNPRAGLAIEVFCHRARKYLGAYLAVVGGADAVIFSGGIGENAPAVREKICTGMEWCGLRLDAEKNRSVIGVEARVSVPDAGLHCYVIPSDEEAIIARETARCFGREPS
jgi:acetate kinase